MDSECLEGAEPFHSIREFKGNDMIKYIKSIKSIEERI